MSTVCRMCLAGGGNVTLFCIEDIRLKDIYKKLTDSLFSSEDERPKLVCCFCYWSLLRCWTLSKMARRSEKIFSDLFFKGLEVTHETINGHNLCTKQHLSMSPMQFTDLDDKTIVPQPNNSYLIINKQEPLSVKEEKILEVPLFNTDSFDTHIISKECIKNEMIFEEDNNDGDDLSEHSTNMDDDPLNLKADTDILDTNQAVSQDVKGEFGPKYSMLYHCDICNKMFLRRHKLIKHIKLSHTSKKSDKQIEPTCHSVTPMRVHTGEKPYACNSCDKRFNKIYNLVKHMRIHIRDKPYACNVCGKRYYVKYDLITHIRTHSSELPFACNSCGKKFNRKPALAVHLRVHTGEKPFACSTCDKKFNQKSNLVSHMKIHTGVKPYACSTCFKQYAQKSSLVTHMRIHTGERPYACDSCDRQFNKRGNLISHIRTHTGEKPYTCSICFKQCIQKNTLVRHMIIHTRDKPFACSICDKTFNDKSNLNAHKKLHTN